MEQTRDVRTTVTVLVVALVAASSALAGSADGILLTMQRNQPAAELDLSWSGGVPAYKIYRSSDPSSVVLPANQIGDTAALAFAVPEGSASVEFFRVTGFAPTDLDSAVSASSSCLTASTNARSAIVVELVDTFGNPVTDATVTMSATDGTLGPVQVDGNSYRAELTPASAPSGSVTVSATADGMPLSRTAVVVIADPVADLVGGAGGCPADGNLRIRVVDARGLPLAGAHVMVGDAEALNLFRTTFGAEPDGDNTGLTDGSGTIEFRDLDSELDGPLTVTAAADLRRYLTLIDVDAADVVLPLPLVEPVAQTGVYTGNITPIPAPANDPIEFGVMLPDFTLDSLVGFNIDSLFADSQCYNAGGVAGQVATPSNVYFPSQCAVSILFCIQSLPEKSYVSADLPYGDRRLFALSASAPLSALTSGNPSDVLTGDLRFLGAGVVDDALAVPGPTALNLPITNSLTNNLTCQVDGAPLNSDVFCIAAGDWDSAGDPARAPGGGRLFVTGFEVVDSATVASPFDISGVATVRDTGSFSGIEYLGAAIAQYIDPLEPGIPVGTANGTSAILDRSATLTGAGGTVVLDDFFPIRTLSRFGREFTSSPLPGAGHPSPHFTRVVVDQRIDELYTACVLDDSARVRRNTLWEVYLPGDVDVWNLPTPPLGWPREEAGGDLAGLVDPTLTPENDALVWDAETYHLGLSPGFDFDRIRLSDVRDFATHLTTNSVSY